MKRGERTKKPSAVEKTMKEHSYKALEAEYYKEDVSKTSDITYIKKRLDKIDKHFKKNKANARTGANGVEVAFGISLKSKKVSRNWIKVQNNLSKTLRSILNNTDQNFRIIIAGHEKPNIEEMNHERVTWLSVAFSRPRYIHQYSLDKFRKRRVIGAYLRRIGFNGYFMPLDADDWIHFRFVEYIRTAPISDAFILNKGFMVNLKNNQVWLKDRFFIGCGSSVVFYFSNKDFPRTSRNRDVRKTKFKWTIWPHHKITQYLRSKNYRMVDFPFVTWVLFHGDNNSVIKRKSSSRVSPRKHNRMSENFGDWFYKYFKVKN
ncbi:hypothetical protein [Neobacillus mesonae]|uniref:hypothetical protein n=1 Tax=Neobacillus mesonae TaxID=1193713 RepID=UPI0025734902|nr:hypothetical protein [Neobacillus mesonae]